MSDQPKFTPGPWEFSSHKEVLAPNGKRLATAGVVLTSGEEAFANARLIAAAPDLLRACLVAMDDGNATLRPHVFTALMRAIEKATGTSLTTALKEYQ